MDHAEQEKNIWALFTDLLLWPIVLASCLSEAGMYNRGICQVNSAQLLITVADDMPIATILVSTSCLQRHDI